LASIVRIDRENIWLKTDNKEVKERFKPLEKIKIRSCFANTDDILPKKGILECLFIDVHISLEKIEEIKSITTGSAKYINNNDEKTRLKNILFSSDDNHECSFTKILQVASLLNDQKLCQILFIYLNAMKFDYTDMPLNNRETATIVLLEECMRRNNQDAFKEIVQKDPLCVLNNFVESLEINYYSIDEMIRNAKGVHDTRKTLFCDICTVLYNNIVAKNKK
jgi:hypothetical protein